MLIPVAWHLPGRILYTYPAVTTEEMLSRERQVLKLLQNEGQPPLVHLLIDCTAPEWKYHRTTLKEADARLRTNEELQNLRNTIIMNPMFGWVISFGALNPSVQTVSGVMSIRNGYRRHVVETLPEAYEFLVNVDPSLEGLLKA